MIIYKIINKNTKKIIGYKQFFYYIKKRELNYIQAQNLQDAEAIIFNNKAYFIIKKSENNLIEETEFDEIIIKKVEDIGDLLTEFLISKGGEICNNS